MYLLLIVSALLMTGNTALTKIFQKSSPTGIFHMVVYNLINAACFMYFIVSLTGIFQKKSNSYFKFLVRMKKNIDKVFP